MVRQKEAEGPSKVVVPNSSTGGVLDRKKDTTPRVQGSPLMLARAPVRHVPVKVPEVPQRPPSPPKKYNVPHPKTQPDTDPPLRKRKREAPNVFMPAKKKKA
jgi:hypothetical protein